MRNGKRFIGQTSGRAAFTLIELLVTLSIIAILAGLIVPVISKAKRRASSVHCQGNLRQLGIALRIYADDNEGRLPVIREVSPTEPFVLPWKQVLLGVPADTFQCRADRGGRHLRTGSSYDWNHSLNGRLLHRVASSQPAHAASESQAMLYDHEAWHGHKNGVFPDGHVERLKSKDQGQRTQDQGPG